MSSTARPSSTRPARSQSSTRRVDPAASMSLLNELLTHPLDPAYEWEAERKRAAGRPASDSLRSGWLLVVGLVVGLTIAISAASLRVPVGQAQKERDGLISRINKGQRTIENDNATIRGLNRDIGSLQTNALKQNNKSSTATALSNLGVVTGDAGATGPGLKLTVKDPPVSRDAAGNPRTDGTDTQQTTVSSSDLQIIVNGLWQSGAEAIAINDQRLTSVTAIRFAGQAVLVNFRPLVPPYVITAIGPQQMKQRFDASTAASYLKGLSDQFGVSSSTQTSNSLTVPALPQSDLKYAKQLKEPK